MRNLSDFNDINNVQDVYISFVILKYRWEKIKESTGFSPRCFTYASTLSGATKRVNINLSKERGNCRSHGKTFKRSLLFRLH